MAENEFSTGFSTAFDAAAMLAGNPVCYPPGTNWACISEEEITALDPDLKTLSEALAWQTLAALSGWQIGLCPVTVRPCLAGCGAPGTWLIAPVSSSGNFAGVWPGRGSAFAPYVGANGAWFNACGCSTNDCSCSQLCEAILPGTVGKIEEVWLDGAVLDRSAYRVDNGNRLVRTDGGCWPSCQDMAQDAHGDNAFSVTYYQGAAPDQTILWAAGKLAQQFYAACAGGSCSLPLGTVSVVRQGISVEIDAGFFPNGRTNIPEVDAILAVYNPYGLRTAPVIASPDTRRKRVTTIA